MVMRRRRAAAAACFFLVAALITDLGVPMVCAAGLGVRPAAAEGFYPGSPTALRNAVEGYLREARPHVPTELKGQGPRAIIVPHAGYTYSGQTAALAYKPLQGKEKPSRVILIGPSHHIHMPGACSVPDYRAYETPLGQVSVDQDALATLTQSGLFHKTRIAHSSEHCLEVQIPFLQVLWPDPPQIVPIVVGGLSAVQCRAAAAQVAKILDEDSLLIISTDFTHYGPRFRYTPFKDTPRAELREKIRELDMRAVRCVEDLDPDAFRTYVAQNKPTICGRNAVSVALEIFSRASTAKAVFLDWANSGENTGKYSDCVSYVAMAIYSPAEGVRDAQDKLQGASVAPEDACRAPVLTAAEKRTLLSLARRALEVGIAENDVAKGADVRPEPADITEALCANSGVFVTLTDGGRLRGCVGRISSDEPVFRSVTTLALMAALRDPRFPAVTADELGDVEVEISVLSIPAIVTDPEQIQVGRDGLIVRKGAASGLLLPQVAVDNQWGRVEFLEQTCRKAGLPTDAWKDDAVMVVRFTATVFNESERDAW